jgi:hypothetical protein
LQQQDVLIPSQDIENFMQLQAKRGVPVQHQKWEDTVHVEHFRKYPLQYSTIVETFVRRLHNSGCIIESATEELLADLGENTTVPRTPM